MTLQEAFNKAYLGLRSQGFERAAEKGTCLYRASDGKKCAIGWLIDDETAHKFGFHGFTSVLDKGLVPDELNCLKESGQELQSCHDVSNTPLAMKFHLESFAQRHGLTIPE